MRRFVIGFGVLVVVVVLAVVIFAATFNVNKYHSMIQSELEKRLQREVTLGDMHLGLSPLRFQGHNLMIPEDPHFGMGASFVKAQQLDVSVKFLPLVHKQIEVD